MYQSIRECNRHTSYVTLASVKPSLFSYIHLRAIINVCFQNNEPDGDRDVKVSPQNVTLRLRPGTIPHTVDKVVTLRGQLIFWFVAEIYYGQQQIPHHDTLLNPTIVESNIVRRCLERSGSTHATFQVQ